MARKPAIKMYRGPLTPKQAAEGMNAAARSAKRLYEDAEILFAAGRFPSACATAVLSIEEAGKLSILRELACASSKARLNAAWRRYADHREKNAQWILFDLAAKGARTLIEFSPIFDRQSDHPDVLNVIKQLGFYSDCYGDAHWSEPHEIVDEKLARSIVLVARIFVPKHDFSERELDLWVRHVGPHWGKPTMQQATLEFQRAAEAEGLARHTEQELREFYGVPAQD